MKRIKKRVPSGKVRIRYRRGKIKIAKCAICKRALHGIPRLVQNEMRKLAKSERRPERPYGGYLCSKCTRELFREKIRSMR